MDETQRICSADGCDRAVFARGLCSSCYSVWYRERNPGKAGSLAAEWRKRNADKVAVYNATRRRQDPRCKVCKGSLASGHRQYCDECRRDRKRKRDRERRSQYPPRPEARVQYRRSVAERDEWQCGICRTPIDPQLEYPHPHSLSLDHIVPIVLGGPHAWGNVQAAHLVCNIKKGSRVLRCESESASPQAART